VTSLRHFLGQTAALLDRLGRPWALVGGWAVSVRAAPRFTRDVDLAVAVGTDAEAEAVVRAFRADGFEISAIVEQDAANRMATVRLATAESTGELLLDLLFASSGIEPEICAQADRIEVLPGLVIPVAQCEHLLALKVLARDDQMRPQDAGDIRALIRLLDATGVEAARQALELISSRGFDRGRDLVAALNQACADFL
jgi:predicted nucleotidyltransferase